MWGMCGGNEYGVGERGSSGGRCAEMRGSVGARRAVNQPPSGQ